MTVSTWASGAKVCRTAPSNGCAVRQPQTIRLQLLLRRRCTHTCRQTARTNRNSDIPADGKQLKPLKGGSARAPSGALLFRTSLRCGDVFQNRQPSVRLNSLASSAAPRIGSLLSPSSHSLRECFDLVYCSCRFGWPQPCAARCRIWWPCIPFRCQLFFPSLQPAFAGSYWRWRYLL